MFERQKGPRNKLLRVEMPGRFEPQKLAANSQPATQARCKVYVSNLTYDCSWQELKDHFKKIGRVERTDIIVDNDGKSKGCGIVEYSNSKIAGKAIIELNGTELKGRTIHVREDRESVEPAVPARIYVSNLAYETSWQDLKDHFKKVGFVSRADVMMDDNGKSKGYGVVEFTDTSSAQKAIVELNNTLIGGREIFVRIDRDCAASSKIKGTGYTKLFVGNLSFDVAWQDLKDHFKQAGFVTRADVVLDNDGKSKGYGIVEFGNTIEANYAIETLNGSDLNGRTIVVRVDREEKQAVFAVDSNHASSYRVLELTPKSPQKPKPLINIPVFGNKVFVGNLSFDVTWQDLKDYFKTVGSVVRADVATDSGGKSKGHGIVEFTTSDDACEVASQLNNTYLNGRQIYVREDREEKFH